MESNEYKLADYQSVVNTKESTIKQMNFIERNCAVLVGLIWAWLSTQELPNTNIEHFGWWVPFIISLVSMFRVVGLNQLVHDCEKYLRKVEAISFKNDEIKGWNTFKSEKRKGKSFIGISAYLYWIILLCAGLVVPLIQLSLVN